jgi:hypothetical protein
MSKIAARHLERKAFVYVRQSSIAQVEHHRESTQRQYALRERAVSLGWRAEQVEVVDDDQGQSGASASGRGGFQRPVSEVALGWVGAVLGLEVSRLARSCVDWYRLLEVAALACWANHLKSASPGAKSPSPQPTPTARRPVAPVRSNRSFRPPPLAQPPVGPANQKGLSVAAVDDRVRDTEAVACHPEGLPSARSRGTRRRRLPPRRPPPHRPPPPDPRAPARGGHADPLRPALRPRSHARGPRRRALRASRPPRTEDRRVGPPRRGGRRRGASSRRPRDPRGVAGPAKRVRTLTSPRTRGSINCHA